MNSFLLFSRSIKHLPISVGEKLEKKNNPIPVELDDDEEVPKARFQSIAIVIQGRPSTFVGFERPVFNHQSQLEYLNTKAFVWITMPTPQENLYELAGGQPGLSATPSHVSLQPSSMSQLYEGDPLKKLTAV